MCTFKRTKTEQNEKCLTELNAQINYYYYECLLHLDTYIYNVM